MSEILMKIFSIKFWWKGNEAGFHIGSFWVALMVVLYLRSCGVLP